MSELFNNHNLLCTRYLILTDAHLSSTLVSSSGLKTRVTHHFGTIISELSSCLRIHDECTSRLGGVSLEFTGEFNDDNEEGYSVTECLGGSMELSEEELGLRYQVRIITPIILRVNILEFTYPSPSPTSRS